MKKQHHEEHVDETWLIPYADMLTLLLALFIVMFAMSKIDKEKFEQLSTQLHTVFVGGSGMMQSQGASIIPLQESGGSGNSGEDGNNASEGTGQGTNESIEEGTMNEIKKELEMEIAKEGYSDKVKVTLNNNGLEIAIQDVVLFNSGNADVIEDVHPLLKHIAGMVRHLDNNIKITGHTDNVPISSGKFRSNWDLSALRAINVMNLLIEEGKLDPGKFSIQAYGEYNPKYDNSSAEGRAKNRRVEIFVVRKYPITSQPAEEATGD